MYEGCIREKGLICLLHVPRLEIMSVWHADAINKERIKITNSLPISATFRMFTILDFKLTCDLDNA